jgi:hypothetical protein
MMGIKTDNMIFVFGSNLGGIHGSGAAAFARNHRGAQLGVGVGRTGQCYAIPTKGVATVHGGPDDGKVYVGKTLDLNIIKTFVDEFIAHAIQHPEHQFQVTRIGCGLAGLKDGDIAPMFQAAPNNCWFDRYWQGWFGADRNYWGTF